MKTIEIPAIIAEAETAGCGDANQICGYLAAEVSKLRDRLRGLVAANGRLAEIDPIEKLTHYEMSPTKNAECHRRWVNLHDAIIQADAALACQSKSGSAPIPQQSNQEPTP